MTELAFSVIGVLHVEVTDEYSVFSTRVTTSLLRLSICSTSTHLTHLLFYNGACQQLPLIIEDDTLDSEEEVCGVYMYYFPPLAFLCRQNSSFQLLPFLCEQ